MGNATMEWWKSIQTQDVSAVKKLVDLEPNYIFLTNENGFSGAGYASFLGYIDVLDVLIAAKSDLNHVDKKGLTPLMYACYSGRVDVIHFLLNFKLDINKKNYYGTTALMYACASGKETRKEMAELLLLHGANILDQDDRNWSSLIYTLYNDDSELMLFLLSSGADLNELFKAENHLHVYLKNELIKTYFDEHIHTLTKENALKWKKHRLQKIFS